MAGIGRRSQEQSGLNDQVMMTTVKVTKALGDVQRLRILSLLEHGELCVCQIIEVLGLAPSTVSKHLSS